MHHKRPDLSCWRPAQTKAERLAERTPLSGTAPLFTTRACSEPVAAQFPIRAWTDGATAGTNPGPCAYGALILFHGKRHEIGAFLGPGTNNIAEYRGMIAVLAWLVEHAPRERALIRTDAQLVAYRLNGTWKKKHSDHPHIQALINEARGLMHVLPHVRIEWVPREQNTAADEIASRYLERKLEPLWL